MKTTKIYVQGNVQGVMFRNFIKENADRLGLRGFVRNLDNGKVEIVVEGKDENINEMVELCKEGPKHSQVSEIEVQEIKHQGFEGFKILKI